MNESLFAAAQGADTTGEAFALSLAPGEILLGTLTAIDSQGQPQVSFAGMDAGGGVSAIATVSVTQQHIGRQVALLFANGDFRKPVIVGIVHSPLHDLLENFSILHNIEVASASEDVPNEEALDEDPFDGRPVMMPEKPAPLETMHVDGKRVVIEGQEEIVLSCGESSITLTKAGKILIRGKYLLSRSSGVNRILGGSVQVN